MFASLTDRFIQIFEEFSQIDPETAAEVIIESSESSAEDEDESEAEAEEIPGTPLAIIDTIESLNETVLEADPNEIDGENRTFTVLSTAALPPPPRSPSPRPQHLQRTASNDEEDREQQPDSSTDVDIPTASTIRFLKEERVQTLTPRRRDHLSSNDTLYHLYQQRLTNPHTPVGQKRSLSDQNDGAMRKKAKSSPECVVLD